MTTVPRAARRAAAGPTAYDRGCVARAGTRALDDHPLFTGERRRWRRLYARHAEHVQLPVGAVLLAEGREPTQVTLIRHGRAAVTRWGERLGEVGPGRCVGAAELAGPTASDVTVVVTEPVDALVLHRRAFRGACQLLPGVRARARAARV